MVEEEPIIIVEAEVMRQELPELIEEQEEDEDIPMH